MMVTYERSYANLAIEYYYTDFKDALLNVLIARIEKRLDKLENPPPDYFNLMLSFSPPLFGMAAAFAGRAGSAAKQFSRALAKEATAMASTLSIEAASSRSSGSVMTKVKRFYADQAAKVRKHQHEKARVFWDMLTKIETDFKKRPPQRGQSSTDYLVRLGTKVALELQTQKFGYTYWDICVDKMNLGGEYVWDEGMKEYITLYHVFKKKYLHRTDKCRHKHDPKYTRLHGEVPTWISQYQVKRPLWSADMQSAIIDGFKKAEAYLERVEGARREVMGMKLLAFIFGDWYEL